MYTCVFMVKYIHIFREFWNTPCIVAQWFLPECKQANHYYENCHKQFCYWFHMSSDEQGYPLWDPSELWFLISAWCFVKDLACRSFRIQLILNINYVFIKWDLVVRDWNQRLCCFECKIDSILMIVSWAENFGENFSLLELWCRPGFSFLIT